jgi:leucyl-tRNA synthetase
MGKNVILLADEGDKRAAAVAACMRRLWGVEEHPQRSVDAGPKTAADPSAVSRVLHELHSRGRLFFNDLGTGQASLCYAPSALAKRLLFESGASDGWPARVAKEMEKSTQVIPGALFRFPLFDDDGYVEAFITDWAPFPAACAVAVHPSHPLGNSVQNEPNRWTGKHVRNPLTGDLMAVWTAGWVRPEFGTVR